MKARHEVGGQMSEVGPRAPEDVRRLDFQASLRDREWLLAVILVAVVGALILGGTYLL